MKGPGRQRGFLRLPLPAPLCKRNVPKSSARAAGEDDPAPCPEGRPGPGDRDRPGAHGVDRQDFFDPKAGRSLSPPAAPGIGRGGPPSPESPGGGHPPVADPSAPPGRPSRPGGRARLVPAGLAGGATSCARAGPARPPGSRMRKASRKRPADAPSAPRIIPSVLNIEIAYRKVRSGRKSSRQRFAATRSTRRPRSLALRPTSRSMAGRRVDGRDHPEPQARRTGERAARPRSRGRPAGRARGSARRGPANRSGRGGARRNRGLPRPPGAPTARTPRAPRSPPPAASSSAGRSWAGRGEDAARSRRQ